MKPNVNDRVTAQKFVLDTWYQTTGKVLAVTGDNVKILDDNGTTDYYNRRDVTILENELSRKYKVPFSVVQGEMVKFIQQEGYFETDTQTIECEYFDQWMKLAMTKPAYRTREPYHKSDLGVL